MNGTTINNTFANLPGSLRIKKLWLIPNKRVQKDVYQRSFSLDASFGTINKLENLLQSEGADKFGNISKNAVATFVPELVKLNTTPTGIVTIPNGWATQRLRFIMEVESVIGDMTEVAYMQGFSEYYDPSILGSIDDKMTFYINSITTVIKTVDPVYGRVNTRLKNSYNVVTNLAGQSEYQEIGVPGGQDLHLIRPEDILEDIHSLRKFEGLADNLDLATGTVYAKASTIDRKHNDPSTYITDTLNSFIDGMTLTNDVNKVDSVAKAAKRLVGTENVMRQPLLFKISGITGELTVTSFTLEILNKVDPNVANVTKLFENDGGISVNIAGSMLDSDNVMDNMQPTAETMIASIIANSIPTIMMDNLLTSLSVSFSNSTGQPVVVPSDAKSFIEGIDPIAYTNRALTHIRTVLMPEISNGNQIIVEVNVSCDIIGMTNIAISINLQPPVLFRFPTYADSLYVPTVADKVTKAQNVKDFGDMIDTVYATQDVGDSNIGDNTPNTIFM